MRRTPKRGTSKTPNRAHHFRFDNSSRKQSVMQSKPIFEHNLCWKTTKIISPQLHTIQKRMLFRQPIIFFKLDNLPSIISSKYLPKLYRYQFCVLSHSHLFVSFVKQKSFFLIAAYLFSDKGMTYGTSKLLFNHPPKEILFSSKIKGIVTEDFFCLQLNEILNKRATVEFGHLQEDCMKCQDQFSFSEMFNTTDKLTLNKLSFERCMGL